MRIVRFASPSGMSFGVLDGAGQVAQIEGHPFGTISFTGQRYAQADVRLLSPFIPERGKIQPRRISGTCAKHQRALQTAISRARQLALIPYVTD